METSSNPYAAPQAELHSNNEIFGNVSLSKAWLWPALIVYCASVGGCLAYLVFVLSDIELKNVSLEFGPDQRRATIVFAMITTMSFLIPRVATRYSFNQYAAQIEVSHKKIEDCYVTQLGLALAPLSMVVMENTFYVSQSRNIFSLVFAIAAIAMMLCRYPSRQKFLRWFEKSSQLTNP